MKCVLDHCVPRTLAKELSGYDVVTARKAGWDRLSNGRLMQAAREAGYDVLITVDRNLAHQHQIGDLPLTVIILHCVDNTIDSLLPHVPALAQLLRQRLERRVYELGAQRQ